LQNILYVLGFLNTKEWDATGGVKMNAIKTVSVIQPLK